MQKARRRTKWIIGGVVGLAIAGVSAVVIENQMYELKMFRAVYSNAQLRGRDAAGAEAEARAAVDRMTETGAMSRRDAIKIVVVVRTK